MSRKQVWFALPIDYSPDGIPVTEDSAVFTWKEFSSLRESMECSKLSQYSPTSHLSTDHDLSQYSLKPSMENQTNETHSTTDSQEVSTSQLESTSDGQYIYEDANSTSSQQDSQHDEVVNSVIMEVSGELMLGNYVPHKHQIGGSESSDLSEDDARRFGSGGVIAKYPESSTGMSDNDWNPYATESDTNQTPRSPTSSASDDRNKIGFVSKATFNIVPSENRKEPAVTTSVRTDMNTQDRNRPDRVDWSSIEEKQKRDKEKSSINNEKRTDFKSEIFNGLRHAEDSEELNGRNSLRSSQEEKSAADGTRPGPPNNARSNLVDCSKLEREPVEFGTPVTASTESFKSLQSDHSEYLSGQHSTERQGGGEYRRESGESAKSLQSDGTCSYRSGRQSTDSGRSNRGCHSEVDMGEGDSLSGGQSLESHKSFLLEKSRGSNYSQQNHKSSGRATGSDRSDRLDLLGEDRALHFKSLIESEDAQRATVEMRINAPRPFLGASQDKRQNVASGDSVSHMRYATRSEPYFLPVKSAQSPVRNVERYVSVAERERLLLKNRDVGGYVSRSSLELEDKISDSDNIERARISSSATQIPRFSAEHSSARSPCDVSMKRVAALVEETKRQTREAVAIPRPDPSGSEERFPLHERLTWSKHDDSFKILENSSGLSKVDSQNSKSKDSVTAKSTNCEEVSRVLWKYTYDDVEKTRKDGAPSKCSKDSELVSAVEPVENSDIASSEGGEILRRYAVADKLNLKKNDKEPEDEKAKKVKAVLSETGQHSVASTGNTKMFSANYVPHTIDYTRLQRDLEEIQDSLQNCPTPKANDSVYALRRQALDSNSPREDIDKSLDTTGTTGEGRESGVSDLGRKLFWDHGADLQYDHDYSGQFLATSSVTDTLSSRFHGSENMDKLVVRPDSAATDDTENEGSQLDDLKTLTGSDITRSERLLEQVWKQRPERAVKDSVEDIIARYRNERQDLFERCQTSKDSNISNIAKSLEQTSETKQPSKLTDPDLILPQKQRTDEKKLPGLAERVYKILTAEQGEKEETDQEEKGMAKKVYKILSTERPQEQVDDILSATMAEEHEMAKKMAMAQVDNSSLDDSGLNESADSFSLDEQDVRKRLQWSQLSSPEKGNKSDFGMIREVMSVPYSAFNNANSLLSTQLKKMSERNFDKSTELRTPYRQAVDSFPLYRVDRETNVDSKNVREAWMPARRSTSKGSSSDKPQALSSERFYLTNKDQAADKSVSGSETIPQVHAYNSSETMPRVRTYSDPFEVSPTRLGSLGRDIHLRSKSEEAANVSDLSQYSFTEPLSQHNTLERNNITKSGDFRILPELDVKALSTPAQHRTQETTSPVESDTSSSRKGSRLRPYRPAGSRDVYYTESGDDTNDSGTTIESTHPGSDDAAPPYIPAQYLGSRKDGEEKHSKGIYGNREKDVLSTIDENSVKGDKERALTASTGNGRDSQKGNYDHPLDRHDMVVEGSSCMDQQDAMTLNVGYHNNQQMQPRFIESSRSQLEFHNSTVDPNSKLDKYKGLEKLGFKTREEFQQDFEKREQELKELLSERHMGHVPMPRHQSGDLPPSWHQPADIPQQHDSLDTTVRSDPGGMLEGGGSRWEYRDSDHNEFQVLIPEPLYPHESLRYSRSKSDSDLMTMSPAANQKYSSPMLPGTRFLELTSQHSPIFSHHDSFMLQHSGHPEGLAEPLELPRVDIEKELQQPLPAKELPRAYVRRSLLSTKDFTIESSRHLTKSLPSENIARPLEPSEFPVRPLEPGADPRSLNQRLASAVRPVQSLDLGVNTNIYRSADAMGPVYDHDSVRVPSAPALRSDVVMDAVELGADPRKMVAVRKSVNDAAVHARSKTPLHLKQKEMEAELEKLNKHLSDQVSEIQEPKKPANEVFEDNFPPSKKAQVLREVLEQEYMENLPPNINDMWTRFKETKEQSMSDSSLNSTRLDALMGLLKNPTHHAVNSLIKERTKLNEKKKTDENFDKLKVENSLEIEKQKKRVDVKAVEERRSRRQEMRQQHGTSEEDSNGSYSEILIENERKKEKGDGDRRSIDKKKSSSKKRSKSPSKKSSNSVENDAYSKEWKKDETCLTDISTCATQPMGAKHVDSMDTLFSIPEDASFEQSPSKAESDMKSRLKRQRHVIDPVMKKLHDKIKLQRTKIDRERRKELQRVEKLKKLEMLLNAKRKGRLSDKAIGVELENVSSTTSYSETSQAMSDVTVSVVSSSLESDASTRISDSSTLKESSIDSNIKLQVKKYPESFSGIKKHVVESTCTDSSDFSNIIVERIPENKSEKRTKDRKGHTKGKKVKVNENEYNKNNKDNQNSNIFGVKLSEKDLQRQLEQYATYLDPLRQKKLKQDASTMYPSPIRLNPPSNRRIKEVLMTSKAIQTSPSLRPTSPTHAYDEVPVAPVPYMSNISDIAPRRQPVSALSKSIQTSPGRTSSKSPASRTLHKSSQVSKSSNSLATRKSPKSPILSQRDTNPTMIQKQVHTPVHTPEDTTMLPKNSMFSPESDENTLPPKMIKEAEAWFVPLKSSKPWRQPLKERQAFSVRQEIWKPDSIANSTWKNIMHNVSVRDMHNVNVSTDTKFTLDPEGQPIQDDNDMMDSDDDFGKSKPLYKMSLQEAFENQNPVMVSRFRERQKRLRLATVQRKMEADFKLEREKLFQDEKKLTPNPDAHPYSDNLHKPEKRVISKEEMKELTEKKYKKLPEVLEHKKLKKRAEEYSLNRLKARIFNRKVQKKVLMKAEKWGR